MTQSLKSIKANVIISATSSITTSSNIGGNLLPTANVTYDLGSSTARWKDIYLANNTIYLGNTAVSANSILPINLDIAPEVLTINVAAPAAGDDTTWLWNWQTSTLPYARTTIVNSAQVSVPLYKQGTYQINNFANEQTGNMTQRHEAHLKWIDGAGVQNLVSWAVETGNVSMANVNINSGANTVVQRINVSVPSTVTAPTLVQPSGISYNVSFANTGAYTITGNADGDNKNIGPLYRGSTYTFNLASSLASHPFYITTDNGTGFISGSYIGEYTTGVTGSRNNGSAGQTTLIFTVPNNAPDTLYYQCGIHSMMRGAIVIKDLAVETNINGNYVLYFQHTPEGHKTPVEIRPIPSLVNQMCVVYDASVGKFVPQDLATYVENTPSFKNKIREVAGTATLIAPNGVAVVPTVLIVEDTSYLPLINNKDGDIAFDAYYDTIYVWETNAWRNSKPTSVSTVTTNAQPNITSVGTLTELSVSGNTTITGNLTVSGTTTTINSTTVSVNDLNLVLANNATTAAQANGSGITINGAGATMNYISSSNSFTFSHTIVADGSLLTSLTGANVSGFVPNANIANTAYSVSASNISGTINLATYATTANAVAGANVSGTVANATYAVTSGTSYAVAVANVSGIGNIATINKDGNASNILYGNGVFAAPAVVSSYGNSNVATFLGSYGSNTISTTGNITAGNANLGNIVIANYHSGSGNLLSNIQGANVTGYVPNANIANTAYSVAVANVSGIGNIATINLSGNASTVLYGNGVFAATSGSGASATIAGTAPSANTAGSLWYDNVTTGELYVYDGNTWVSTSIVPMTNATDPVLSGVNQANEYSNITITITNYSNSYAYQVTTTSGTTTRSNASIYWQLPSVDSNTAHSMTVQAISGSGVASSIVTKVVTVLNTAVTDTAIIVSDFSYSDLNTGWTM